MGMREKVSSYEGLSCACRSVAYFIAGVVAHNACDSPVWCNPVCTHKRTNFIGIVKASSHLD
jgi:hypothetical protein